ncbi:hypothetical protein BS47DRAFT_1364456 [Hydnum rufescens UP504]|uniref:Uncharacterized protein n=1 Tax=Hydnum rufescens UP504 TaxID=1448309 RepID=A0A9P6AR98_9AGAM|nr:hypothetical protein BS47DRAFT_1364456 [Hydnum rufescens UP504]
MKPHPKNAQTSPTAKYGSARSRKISQVSTTYTTMVPHLLQRVCGTVRYGTTHPLQWIPSLSENLPDEDTDQPPTRYSMCSRPSLECLAPEHDDRPNLVPHTHCGCGTSCVFSIHETPPTRTESRSKMKHGLAQPPATRYEHPCHAQLKTALNSPAPKHQDHPTSRYPPPIRQCNKYGATPALAGVGNMRCLHCAMPPKYTSLEPVRPPRPHVRAQPPDP